MYCGFNRKNDICRAQLDQRGIVRELDAIAETGLEDVLLLTGEDRERTDPPTSPKRAGLRRSASAR